MSTAHTLSEAAFQTRVMEAAQLYGWRVVHIRAQEVANKAGGKRWAVPYEGDSGLPDLILARGGVLLIAELKSDVGKLTPDQLRWLEAAGDNGHCWRPRNWPDVLTILQRKKAA